MDRLTESLLRNIPTAEEEALRAPDWDPIDGAVAFLTGGTGLASRLASAGTDIASQGLMNSSLPSWMSVPASLALGMGVGRMVPDDAVPMGLASKADDGLNVVSMFDGIGGLAEASRQADLPIRNYTAYEIDPRAAAIAQRNHPYIVQRGDVNNFTPPDEPVDLLCGGFPCQDLSRGNVSGQGLEGDRSGLFWKLVDAIKTSQPKNFIVENVLPRGSRSNDTVNRISDALGVEATPLDAKDFSSMARPRLFWSNLPIESYEPSTATLADSLDPSVPDKYWLSPKAIDYMNRPAGASGRTHFDRHGMDLEREKARTIPRVASKGVPYNVVRFPDGNMRRLTPEEVEQMFGYPRGYTEGYPDSVRLEALGNSFSVPTLAHILRRLKGE